MFRPARGLSPLVTASSKRATRARIDLDALRHNVRVLREIVGPRTTLMALVKADAYGHGSVLVARAALEAGAKMLGVATVDEGVVVRQAGIDAPILAVAPTVEEEFDAAIAYEISLAVGSFAMAARLASRALSCGKTAGVQIEVDTGLHRFGIPSGHALDEIARIAGLDGLRLEGLYTHMATSETPEEGSAVAQILSYETILERLAALGIGLGVPRHAANSGGVLEMPRSRFDIVRPGLALYGYHPAGPDDSERGLRPVMSLTTRLVRLEIVAPGAGVSYNHTFTTRRETTLGLVPAGYGDGLPRLLSNRGHMLVRGRRAPIVGRVCMDQTVLDVTDVPGVAEGDEVVVIGVQGDEFIGADEIARHAETNVYEILCGIAPRVPRDYVSTQTPSFCSG